MTLLFDIYPAIGHLNASFALANQWRERQHRVVYCAVEAEHKKRIEDNGFECVMLDYLLDSDKQELRVKGLRFILECVISAFTQEREQAFSRRAADWEKRLRSCLLIVYVWMPNAPCIWPCIISWEFPSSL